MQKAPEIYLQINESQGMRVERLARQFYEGQNDNSAGTGVITKPESKAKCEQIGTSYDNLPENKKALLLRETVGQILETGFSLLETDPDDDAALPSASGATESVTNRAFSFDQLVSIRRNRNPELWQGRPHLYLQAGRAMLAAGEPLLAYDILVEGIEKISGPSVPGRPDEKQNKSLRISLLQQQALALAQSGATADANALLRLLHDSGISDSETLGILGRTWKDMAMECGDSENRKALLQESFACYSKTYQAELQAGNLAAAYYTGINAAAVSLFGGLPDQSRQIAGQIKQLCLTILGQAALEKETVSFWLYATLGEASLLLGNVEEAEKWYRTAANECSEDIRALTSMRKQSRIILNALESDQCLDQCFPVPSVVLFSGHIIDDPLRQEKRFPAENEETVRRKIALWLDDKKGQIGYSSAACGSDILFLEEMLKRGGEINIVLPFAKESFVRTSVDLSAGNWQERFEHVLKSATEVKVLSQYNKNTLDDDLLFANLYLYGISQVRAEWAGTALNTLLVWDGKQSDSLAGTSALGHFIRSGGGTFDIIPPLGEEPDLSFSAAHPPATGMESGTGSSITVGGSSVSHHVFLPLLIADVKGYSRLSKIEKIIFASNFMREMAAVLSEFESSIIGRKTQGDSLFLVFKDLSACLQSARALRTRTAEIDWKEMGFSAQLTMRISLDAGPCYSYTDPVTGLLDFCGDYIVRAARLEPVTPPGNIYATETFVAIARAFGLRDIRFDYAGQVDLPKGFGRIQAFHVK